MSSIRVEDDNLLADYRMKKIERQKKREKQQMKKLTALTSSLLLMQMK
jgi:hypothetical protein